VEFVDALSNWYVRRSRDRFWRSGKDADKTAAYITLWRCLSTTAELIAPFTPFFAETLYQNLVRPHVPGAEESVHLRKYPEADPAAIDRRLIEEMAIVREIASLGRAARMDAKMKVRQPLPVVELVLANPEHRSWLEGHLPLIAEELNVRSVEFAADADRYVTYEVKPNFKTIGPKFGKLAPKLKAVLPTLNAADLRRQLDTAGKIALTVDGQTLELSPEDVQVMLKAKEGWAAAQGRMVVVVLSTALTPELKAEGLARDFVHLVQTARKEQRLDYQDRIRLRVSTAEPVQGAIEAFRDYIQGETLAVELLLEPSVPETAHGGEIEGTPVRFSLEVVGKGT
jgi:isoleucyl-tRNA synthetase